MTKKDTAIHVTLLVHASFAAFEWGRVLIDLFRVHAAKAKYTLQIVYTIKDIRYRGSPVVVLGVDSIWIKDVLDSLKPFSDKIVLLNGMTYASYESVNYISADQQTAVKKCIDLLNTCGRTRPAFFGVQKNDTSDQIKALSFSERFSSDDVYQIEDSVRGCCDQLLDRLEQYDSVICANDIMAVYLLARCRSLKIDIPGRLYLIGNGNLWLSTHVTPSLTTVSHNADATVRMALQICKNICEYEDIAPVNISFGGHIIRRESTGTDTDNKDSLLYRRGSCFDADYRCMSSELSQIVTLDSVFSSCSKEKTDILRLVGKCASIAEISELVYLSQDTVAYHLKNLYRQLGIHSKKELADIINLYGIRF